LFNTENVSWIQTQSYFKI